MKVMKFGIKEKDRSPGVNFINVKLAAFAPVGLLQSY
jgi:hypothetical protein